MFGERTDSVGCCGSEGVTPYIVIRDLFIACAITCFLWAMHRIANGTVVMAQIASFEQLGEAYTPEEREVLIHKIKSESFRY